MHENKDENNKIIRPTKKQYEILEFIESFINKNGFSPSYREIMAGLNYTSVATVSLHVNSLLKRGHLIKRDHSARSIEVVHKTNPDKISTNEIKPNEEKWIVGKIEQIIKEAEKETILTKEKLDQIYILISSLRILGIEGAANSLTPRVNLLKNKIN